MPFRDFAMPRIVNVFEGPGVLKRGPRSFGANGCGVVTIRVERRVQVDQVNALGIHAAHDVQGCRPVHMVRFNQLGSLIGVFFAGIQKLHIVGWDFGRDLDMLQEFGDRQIDGSGIDSQRDGVDVFRITRPLIVRAGHEGNELAESVPGNQQLTDLSCTFEPC